MKTDANFNKLTPEEYTENLGTNYTRLGYITEAVEKAFEINEEMKTKEPELVETLTKMLDEDAHVEISYNGERLFIDIIDCLVSESGVKKVVIYVSKKVDY